MQQPIFAQTLLYQGIYFLYILYKQWLLCLHKQLQVFEWRYKKFQQMPKPSNHNPLQNIGSGKFFGATTTDSLPLNIDGNKTHSIGIPEMLCWTSIKIKLGQAPKTLYPKWCTLTQPYDTVLWVHHTLCRPKTKGLTKTDLYKKQSNAENWFEFCIKGPMSFPVITRPLVCYEGFLCM